MHALALDAVAEVGKLIITMTMTDSLKPHPMHEPTGERSATGDDAVATSGMPEAVPGATDPHGQEDQPDAAEGSSTDESRAAAAEQTQGGEFQLLLEKLQGWLARQGWQPSLPILKRSTRSLGLLIAVCILLRLEGGLVSTLNSIPLLGRVLLLVGLLRVALFARENLLRQDDRKQLNERLQQLIRETIG